MVRRHKKPARIGLCIAAAIWMMVIVPLSASAAPYAAMVIDARTGKTLHSENANTRLHPASLTKMMTLYVVFEAVEAGEMTKDLAVCIHGNKVRHGEHYLYTEEFLNKLDQRLRAKRVAQ